MLTRKQADKIRNLHNECIIAEIELLNTKGLHKKYDAALYKKARIKGKFTNYVESLVKTEERLLNWTTIPIPNKTRKGN